MNILPDKGPAFSGIITYEKGGTLGERIQRDLQLVTVHRGEARIRIDGRLFRVGPGEAILLLPGGQESFRFSSTSRTRHAWCGLQEPVLNPDQRHNLETVSRPQPFSKRMRTLEQMLLPLSGRATPGEAQLHDQLVRTLVLAYLEPTGILDEAPQPLHPAVERARRHIADHYAEALELADIARHAGITAPHLIRLFKEAMEITPAAYLWRYRTSVATRLLRETGLSTAEVAYRTGFANPQHFSRLFRQHHGLPPRAWRRREWRTSTA